MTQNGSTDHDLYPSWLIQNVNHLSITRLLVMLSISHYICSTKLYFSFKQEYTNTALLKAHLASQLFNNTVLKTITMKANTQLSSGYHKLKGLTRISGHDVSQFQQSTHDIFLYCRRMLLLFLGKTLKHNHVTPRHEFSFMKVSLT